MKLYKGYTRAQLIDILADYAVFTATINNDHGGAPQNTNKGDYRDTLPPVRGAPKQPMTYSVL